jgi:lipopolysaccharide export system permease protein
MFSLLDRYVLRTWTVTFILTALGFPIISILIQVTDSLSRLLSRGLSPGTVVVSYVYSIPENMFMVMPAAVLFATVFTIGGMGRNSEITAAKAGGRSFYRLFLPIFVAGGFAAVLAVVVGELAPGSTARQLELQRVRQARPKLFRYNFVYRGDDNWVYTVKALDVGTRSIRQAVFERQGAGKEHPGLAIVADSAIYDTVAARWTLYHGSSRQIAGPSDIAVFDFQAMTLRAFRQVPAELLAESKGPSEMRYAELGRYIEALRNSGNDVTKLEVERALKLAIPATCLIIVFFAAPLALTAPRAGAAVGIAVSLLTTLAFLLILELSKAVGASGLVDPLVAAWTPEAVFLLAGVVLMARART